MRRSPWPAHSVRVAVREGAGIRRATGAFRRRISTVSPSSTSLRILARLCWASRTVTDFMTHDNAARMEGQGVGGVSSQNRLSVVVVESTLQHNENFILNPIHQTMLLRNPS